MADKDKLEDSLGKLSSEDPTFKVHTDQDTGQRIISGMGELHLEILVDRMMREFGVLYQSGALWSSLTLAENVALPLKEYTDLPADHIRHLASLKLSLVGLAGFEDFYPS